MRIEDHSEKINFKVVWCRLQNFKAQNAYILKLHIKIHTKLCIFLFSVQNCTLYSAVKEQVTRNYECKNLKISLLHHCESDNLISGPPQSSLQTLQSEKSEGMRLIDCLRVLWEPPCAWNAMPGETNNIIMRTRFFFISTHLYVQFLGYPHNVQ